MNPSFALQQPARVSEDPHLESRVSPSILCGVSWFPPEGGRYVSPCIQQETHIDHIARKKKTENEDLQNPQVWCLSGLF